jgi:hypothetical protein
MGPIYDCSREHWDASAPAGGKAIVVLRDPRDRIISWVWSMSHGHSPDRHNNLQRELLHSISPRARVLVGLFEFTRIARHFRSWLIGSRNNRLLISRYERLVADPIGEFGTILGFMDSEVPRSTLTRVLDRLSFAARSGRAPGEENVSSHYRKGVVGDWSNYFDRALGRHFEQRHAGLLRQGGWEQRDDWFESLPEAIDWGEEQADIPMDAMRQAGLESDLVRVIEQRDELERNASVMTRRLVELESGESGGASANAYGELIANHLQLEASHRKLIDSQRQLVNEHIQLEGDHRKLTRSHEQLVREHEQLETSHRELIRNHDELARNHEELIRNHDELARSHEELIANHQELVASHKTLIASQERLVRDHLELTALYQKLTEPRR